MLIIGTRGFAKEVLEVICQSDSCADVVFNDDVYADIPELLLGKLPVLKTLNEAEHYFINTNIIFK